MTLQEFRSLGFWTVLRREVNRFWTIRRQTLVAPLLETYLYISVFGAALGSRISTLEGVPYITYIIPGLIMMAFAMNAFGNNSSSVFQQKIQRAIDDQLASPISNLELLLAFAAGGFLRGLTIATITFTTANLLVDLPLVHPLLFVGSLLLIGVFFALFGVLIGVIAESFDNIAFYQSFVMQPLIFLGGIFYSVTLLPDTFETISRFNPIFYMINTVRYGMLGASDVNPVVSLSAIAVASLVLFGLVHSLFQRGYKLRA